jgi:hypothetical protein
MRYGTAIPVAAGATGRVVRAFDAERGEEVALKLLHRDDPDWVQRMLREAEVQSRLDHPGICPVYGTGRIGDQPFIAMRFIDGVTLDLAAAGLSDRERVALLAGVADAIAYAHAAGVVHRDLKPSNILVERGADGVGRPVVVDFGLVHDVDAPGLTHTGQLLGTPGYMAPEQATAAAHVDGRADVYSLGVVLFELLAGRRPFSGESAAEILVRTLREEPPALESLRPDIDPSLARIVRQCLETSPDERYRDAAALRDDLEAFRDGRRVRARRDTPLRRLRRFSRRHPWRAGSVAVAVVAIVTTIAVSLYGSAAVRRESAAAQRYTERAIAIEHALRLELMKPPHDVAPARLRLRAEVDAFERALPKRGTAASRSGRLALGRMLAAFGEHEQARRHLEHALAAGEDSPVLNATLGRTLMQQYFAALQRTGAIDDPDLRSAAVAELDRDYRLAAREHLLAASRGDDADAEQLRALLDWLDGDPESAEARLEAVAEKLAYPVEALLLSGDLAAADAIAADLDGETTRALGRWREALSRYREASDIARSDVRARAARCRAGGALATLLRHGASIPEAEILAPLAQCDEAIALDSRAALAHASKAQALAELGALERERGTWNDRDFDPAILAARTALTLDEASLPARRALGTLLTQRANWLAERADASAAAAAEEAIALLEDARRREPGSAQGAMLLANARLAAARAALVVGGDPERHLVEADRVLARAAEGGDAPLVLEVRIVENQTWRGFETYTSGRDPGDTLDQAVERAQRLDARAPFHPRVAPALGMASWTRADYLALSGGDAEPAARLSVQAYARVVEREDASFADLFNAVGSLLLHVKIRQERGEPASTELALLDAWLARLRARAGADNPIDIQVASAHHRAAREAARTGGDPRPALQAARRTIAPALDNPLDAREAAVELAEAAIFEHAWRARHRVPDPELAARDRAQLEAALQRFSDHAALLAVTAHFLAGPPHDGAHAAEARRLLTEAFARLPVLRTRYGALAAELGIELPANAVTDGGVSRG